MQKRTAHEAGWARTSRQENESGEGRPRELPSPGKGLLMCGEGSTTLKNNPLLFLRGFKPLSATTPAQTSSSVLSPSSFCSPRALLAGPLHMWTLKRHEHRRRGVSDHPFRRRPLAFQALSRLCSCSSCYPLRTLTDPCAYLLPTCPPQNTSSMQTGSLTAVWSFISCTWQTLSSEQCSIHTLKTNVHTFSINKRIGGGKQTGTQRLRSTPDCERKAA